MGDLTLSLLNSLTNFKLQFDPVNGVPSLEGLRQIQNARNAESFFTEAFGLLTHENRDVRMEAMHFFLTLPQQALDPLLKTYPTLQNPEIQWRTFYILSEKMPKTMLEEARRVHHIVMTSGDLGNKPLEALSLRLLSRISPYTLDKG